MHNGKEEKNSLQKSKLPNTVKKKKTFYIEQDITVHVTLV